MKRSFKNRLSVVAAVVLSVGITSWALAQRNDPNASPDRRQDQSADSAAWRGQMGSAVVDRIAADSIVQMNKGEIELANFALKHTLEFVRRTQEVKASAFAISDLDFLLRHRFDPLGTYRENSDARLAWTRTLAAELRTIVNFGTFRALVRGAMRARSASGEIWGWESAWAR